MADLLIRDLEPELKRRLEERAQKDRLSLSDEAKRLIQKGLLQQDEERGLGTALVALFSEVRGDDLVFERDDAPPREPPTFE